MKKKSFRFLLLFMLVISTVTAGIMPVSFAATSFTDVSSDAYYVESVGWAVDKGITKGTSDTTFSPDDGCTRAQVVTFLWRAAGQPDVDLENISKYGDLKGDDYYANAVAWAVEKNITTGTSDNSFSPEDQCTRAQIATFLWRYTSTPSIEDTGSFVDVKSDAYYAGAVSWAVQNEITKGTSDSTFSPDNTCTRAQIVTFLFRMFEGKKIATVTFDSNGGSTVERQRIAKNQKATEPAQPTKEGSTFSGWYSDSALTTVYSFDTAVTKDITLYAKWEDNHSVSEMNSIYKRLLKEIWREWHFGTSVAAWSNAMTSYFERLTGSVEDTQFALKDLNQDGVDDLLLTDDNTNQLIIAYTPKADGGLRIMGDDETQDRFDQIKDGIMWYGLFEDNMIDLLE